jgi:hypothetical protein
LWRASRLWGRGRWRDDAGNGDLGYPWAALISKHRALVVYYFNSGNGTRHIASTFLALD